MGMGRIYMNKKAGTGKPLSPKRVMASNGIRKQEGSITEE